MVWTCIPQPAIRRTHLQMDAQILRAQARDSPHLCPDSKGSQEHIFSQAIAIYFLKGRVKFHREDGSCPKNGPAAPSCLVTHTEQDTVAVLSSGLAGFLIRSMTMTDVLDPLTEDEKNWAFYIATTRFSGSRDQWAERAKAGLTDEQLTSALENEIGMEGGSCGHDNGISVYEQGNSLKVWAARGWANKYTTSPCARAKLLCASLAGFTASPIRMRSNSAFSHQTRQSGETLLIVAVPW